MVNKKVVISCTIITIFIVALIIGIKVKNFNEQRNSYNEEANVDISKNGITKEIINTTQNDIANEIQNETTNEVKDENLVNKTETEEKHMHNDTTTENIKGEEETESQTQETENKDEKALSLAKKEWGESDDTVYFTIDNNSNNIYNISVRSKSTTGTVAEYEVDVKNNKVTLK